MNLHTARDISEDTVVKVYDPTKQEVILQYFTKKKAANELGTFSSMLEKAISNKIRLYSPSLKMYVAIRIKALSDDFKEIKIMDYLNKQTSQAAKKS